MTTQGVAGEFLRATREARGLTQYDVARRAFMAQPAISRIERGHQSPSVDTLARILDAIDVDLVLSARDRPRA